MISSSLASVLMIYSPISPTDFLKYLTLSILAPPIAKHLDIFEEKAERYSNDEILLDIVIEEAGREELIIDSDAEFLFILACFDISNTGFGLFRIFFPSSETC